MMLEVNATESDGGGFGSSCNSERKGGVRVAFTVSRKSPGYPASVLVCLEYSMLEFLDLPSPFVAESDRFIETEADPQREIIAF